MRRKEKDMKRVFAMLFAVCLGFSAMAVSANGQNEQAQTFSDSILMAVNTNYSGESAHFFAESENAAQVAPQADQTQAASHFQCKDINDVRPLSAEDAARRQAQHPVLAQSAPAFYQVGDHKTIFEERNRTLECVYTGSRCTVWLEDGSDANMRDICVQGGQDFDEVIPKMHEIFGDARIDTDGDGKFALFVHDNPYGGYFTTSDLADKWGRIGSVWVAFAGKGAQCDCVHMNTSYVDTFEMFRSVAIHEYQHYIAGSFCFAGKNNFNYVRDLPSYIAEGFSGCATYMLDDWTDNAAPFSLATTQDEPSFMQSGAYYSVCTGYVFCQYLRTRYAQMGIDDSSIPGSGIYKLFLQTIDRKNESNFLDVFASVLYPKIKDEDARCRQLLKDFWLAAYLKNTDGIYGFNGEEWAGEIDYIPMTRPTISYCETLRGGMANYYRIPHGGSVTVYPQDDVEFVAIPAEVSQSGTCGDHLTWELVGETLVISGQGEMTDFAHRPDEAFVEGAQEDEPSEQYSPFETRFYREIVVEEGVTSVGTNAFRLADSCDYWLKRVTLPRSLKRIGENAFKGFMDADSILFFGSRDELCRLLPDEQHLGYSTREIVCLYNPDSRVSGLSLPESLSVRYRGNQSIFPDVNGEQFHISYLSSDPQVFTVEQVGDSAVVTGRKTGTAMLTCIVWDETGNRYNAACEITVRYVWWQQIIRFLLFGWIWY